MTAPWLISVTGRLRLSCGNHLNKACAETGKLGPSPAPSATREASSTHDFVAKATGSWTTDQMNAMHSRIHREATRLPIKPTTTADSENSQKKLPAITPKLVGV